MSSFSSRKRAYISQAKTYADNLISTEQSISFLSAAFPCESKDWYGLSVSCHLWFTKRNTVDPE